MPPKPPAKDEPYQWTQEDWNALFGLGVIALLVGGFIWFLWLVIAGQIQLEKDAHQHLTDVQLLAAPTCQKLGNYTVESVDEGSVSETNPPWTVTCILTTAGPDNTTVILKRRHVTMPAVEFTANPAPTPLDTHAQTLPRRHP